MKNRLIACVNVLVLCLLAIGFVATAPAAAEDEATTEDVIHMIDGRELHGNILEETDDAIIFEYIDRNINVKTRLTLLRREIAGIDRDVPMSDVKVEKPERKRVRSDDDEEVPERTYGALRLEDEDLPSFYVVPMTGQMGTDVHVAVYKEMVDDIRAKDPDYLMIEMECRDSEDRVFSRISEDEAGKFGIEHMDMYRDLVNFFHDDLDDIKQVLWIKDSLGISSVVALSWKDIYMSPEARLGGLRPAAVNFERVRGDKDMYGKFREAFMAWMQGFAENGGYPMALMNAMVRNEMTLSATWKGREVVWTADNSGEYLVDSSDRETVTFSARAAENFCLSDGTVESLSDVALLLGIREYRELDSEAEEIFENYKEDWRQAFENCRTWLEDYQKYMGWATGEDTLRYLGRAKNSVERVVAAIDRYQAVEVRLLEDFGVRRFDLITIIETLKERIRALRSAGQRGGGGSGAPGSGAGGAGGGRRG